MIWCGEYSSRIKSKNVSDSKINKQNFLQRAVREVFWREAMSEEDLDK